MKKRLQISIVIGFLLGCLFIAVRAQLPAEEIRRKEILLYGILTFILCLLVVVPKHLCEKKRTISYVSVLIAPLVSFGLFEYVSGSIKTLKEAQVGMIGLNVFIWYALYAMIFVICNQVKWSIICMNTLAYVYSVINYFVTSYRNWPIMLTDVKSIGTALKVAGGYSFDLTFPIICMGILMMICNIWAWRLDGSIKPFGCRLAVDFVLTAVCVWGFNQMLTGDVFKKAGSEGMQFVWLIDNYQREGYMATTVQSMRYLKVNEPEGYSMQKIGEIAESVSMQTVRTKELPDNIIVIMDESFTDLSVLGEFQTSQEVLPFLNGEHENFFKGWLHMSVWGTGTANSEFEFLTGNSVSDLPIGAVAYSLYTRKGDPSMVALMEQEGYHTIAFHPYNKRSYNRVQAYDYYGFDEFYGRGDMKYKKLRRYASDEADFKSVIKLYENKEENEKLFLFNVTMQNHGGYEEDFDAHIIVGGEAGKYPQAEQYLSLTNLTDQAFENLTEYFSEVNEKTVIIMFGDHQPALGDGTYDELVGGVTTESLYKFYKTPYYIWSNYDLQLQPGTTDEMSANYFGSYVLDLLGFELPVYNRFLLDMKKEVPVITALGYMDNKMEVMHYWEEENDDDSDVLNNYKILQYNNLFDHQNRRMDLFQ